MTTETSSAPDRPGYWVDGAGAGAHCTLPWPDDSRLVRSLGPQIIRWGQQRLVHHLYGRPWKFTLWQKRFLHLWYAVERTDEPPYFRWVYRSGVKRSAKGSGKDPLGAAWCLTELCGPVVVVDWRDDGLPVGGPLGMPLVQIAANSEAQAKDVLRVANAMVSRAMREEFALDVGETRTIRDGGGRLELLTSSEKSAEGDPATAIMLNESHHMTESNGGYDIAAVARRNVGKSPYGVARLLEFTNAHEEGANSVAEQSYRAWQAQVSGKAMRRDILYDSREASPSLDMYDGESRVAGLRAAYSDATWAPLDRIEGEVLDPRTTVSESLRYYFNLVAANEESWVEPRNFDAMTDAGKLLEDGAQVALFLDCSKSEDSTALIGCRLSDGHVFTVDVWQRPPGERGRGWLVQRGVVDAAVRATFDRHEVVWFGVDPSPAKDDETEHSYWMPLVDAWHRDLGPHLVVRASRDNAVLFDMRTSAPGGRERNRLFCDAAQQTQSEIDDDQAFTHDGDATLRQHVHNARRYPTAYGLSLGKVNRYSTRLVDAAVAMVGARMGRRLVLNSGRTTKPRTNQAVFL